MRLSATTMDMVYAPEWQGTRLMHVHLAEVRLKRCNTEAYVGHRIDIISIGAFQSTMQ